MVENKHMYQFFITLTSGLNFLMKFCRNDLIIKEIISTKFYEKTNPLNPRTIPHWTKFDRSSNGEETSPKFFTHNWNVYLMLYLAVEKKKGNFLSIRKGTLSLSMAGGIYGAFIDFSIIFYDGVLVSFVFFF